MADPIGASKGLQGLSNIAGELSKAGDIGKKGTPGKFEQVRMEKLDPQDRLDQIQKQMQEVGKTGKLDLNTNKEMTMAQRVAAREGIVVRGGEDLKIGGTQDVWRPQQVQATGETQKLAEGIKDFDASQKRLDEIMSELRSGKKYSQEELLQLQMEVHMLSEKVQMTTKLVDSAMQSVKQVMQQQV